MYAKKGSTIKDWSAITLIIIAFVIPTSISAKPDLFVGTHCWLNTGLGVWQRKQAWDIPFSGNVYVHASFWDLDKDMDYDAYVTDDGGTVMAYENAGSDTAPVWQRETAWDFSPTGSQIFWAEFIDIDNDGKSELSVAKYDTVKFFKNTGGTSPVWTREPACDIIVSGSNLGHTYADLDGDGDYDVMVRPWESIMIRAFENIGTANAPVWQEKVSWSIAPDQLLPALGDIDGDGDADIIESGHYNSKAFENIGTVNSPVWTLKMSWLTSDADAFLYPEFVNIDHDGAGVEEKTSIQSARLETFPNPFCEKTTICYSGLYKRNNNSNNNYTNPKLMIYDIAGKLVKSFPTTNYQSPITKVAWDGTDDYGNKVETGIYFCNLHIGKKEIAVKKITLLR